jgi:UDP-N-acetylmuramyl pentapeptide synthase
MLSQLLGYFLKSNADPIVRKVVNHSRAVEPGTLFVAFKGVLQDGHDLPR